MYNIVLRTDQDSNFILNSLEIENKFVNGLKKLSEFILKKLRQKSDYTLSGFIENIELHISKFATSIYDENGNYIDVEYLPTKILHVYVYVTDEYLEMTAIIPEKLVIVAQKTMLLPIVELLYSLGFGVITIRVDAYKKEAPYGYFQTDYKSATLKTTPTIQAFNFQK